MIRAISTRVAHAFRRTALPLGSYYSITLAVPLANGAARSGAAFMEHALVVLLVPPIVILIACAVHTAVRAVRTVRCSSQAALERRMKSAANAPAMPLNSDTGVNNVDSRKT
jgi:hypothetical protein